MTMPVVATQLAAPVSGDTRIEVSDAAVRRGRRTVWEGASFRAEASTFIAVVGPNGAGKTTLLRALLGLVPVSHGSIRVLGAPPHRGNPRIGYVPQRRTLDAGLSVSGIDLVRLGVDGHRWGVPLHAAGDNIDTVLDEVGARGYARRRVGTLSGGEQQRLLLAQALAGDPEVLLLDEPLASLDLRGQVTMAHLVDRVVRRRGVAALMVTHDINPILGVVDQVVYIANGRVLAGPPSEVITTPTLSRIYGGQVEVLRDSHGHVFVVGLDQEAAHAHDE